MNLREYLFYKEMTSAEFARKADLSEAYVSMLCRRRAKPTGKTLRVIERTTDGWVKPEFACAPTKLPEGWPCGEEEDSGKVA
jgi:hypothetical protein